MFVGHERERRLLHSVVTRLAAGHGAAVWLTGEPGIGKSTLVAAAMTAARQMRCHVFGAAAHQLGPRSSLRVLFDAFGVGPDTLRSADRVCEGPAGSTYAEIVGIAYGGLSGQVAVAADLVVRFVEQECAANPVLLVIEDALWADAASLDLLGRLAQAPLRLPFALLVTARPIPSRSEVDAARAVFAAAGAHVLRIAPLDEPDSLALARDLLGAVPGPILGRLVSGAGGNPRYLRDLAEALRAEPRLDIGGTVEVGTSDSLPPGLATAIGRRLTFLSEPTLGVLRIAAVLGPAFPANDLAAVTGHDDGELGRACAEALAAGVLVESPTGTLAFQHRLVQQALYQLLPASIRSALHHEAAEKLAHAGRSAELVARHLLVAPRVAATWELQWLADIAPVLSHLEPSLVIDLLERALDRLDAHDPRRVRAFADLASAKFLLGDNDAVVRLCPAILAQTQDPDLHARTACTLAHALSRLGRVDESLAVTQDALARPRLALRWSAQLRARRAMSLLAAGRPMQAQAAAERAKAEATDVDDGIALSHALFACALVEIHHRRRVVEGASMLERALMTLDGNQPGNVDLALLLTVELGDAMRLIGEPVEADRHFARALAVVERGTPPGQGIVRIRFTPSTEVGGTKPFATSTRSSGCPSRRVIATSSNRSPLRYRSTATTGTRLTPE